MIAAQINMYGGKDAVAISDKAKKPTIADNQALIKVHAASVNPFDITVREGGARQMTELTLPATLGGDFAGTIVELGANTNGFKIGQKVFGQASPLSGNGSFAEFAPVLIKQLQLAPNNIDPIHAAALPLVSVSAYQAIIETIDLKPNQKILIHGGAGGIGSIAIQIAKNIGAYIATTANEKDLEYVKNLGADEVIDYKSQDFSSILKEYDAVFDTVGKETAIKSVNVLKNGGSMVSMVSNIDDGLIDKKEIIFKHQFTQVSQEKLHEIKQMVEAGIIKVNVDKIYSISETAEALEYLKTGQPRGKVVIRIS